jgi:hypothetical protein
LVLKERVVLILHSRFPQGIPCIHCIGLWVWT